MSNNGSPKITPTVFAYEQFNAENDATELKTAMKGFRCNENAIIEIVANRNNSQRAQIVETYKSLYGKELRKELYNNLSGHFKSTIIALMMPLPDFYAKELHDAISGFRTNKEVLVEILCILSNNGIKTVSERYQKLYGHSHEKDIKGDMSDHFRRLIVSLSMGKRDESIEVDKAAAQLDAEALYSAGEKTWGTDESQFNRILWSKSIKYLRSVFQNYQNITSKYIEDSIKSEFFGDIRLGLLALVKCIMNKDDFFVERLHKSMSGLRTEHQTLIRIIVSRSEIDLENIKEAFEKKYGKSLKSWVTRNTSGNYRILLLKLIS